LTYPRVVSGDAVRDLLQAVTQAGVGVHNAGGAFRNAGQLVGRVVFVQGLEVESSFD